MANANDPDRKPLPTSEEIDTIVLNEFPEASGQCTFLCNEIQVIVDELEESDLSPKQRKQLIARLAAINTQRRILHCPQCFLQ